MNPFGAADLSPVRTEHLILSDGRGEFSVSKTGVVTVLSGYPNVGATFAPGTGQHSAVMGNLAAVGNNRQRIEAFTGMKPPSTTTMVATPSSVPAGGAPPAVPVSIPLRERWWFWPAVGTAGVVVSGLVLWQVAGMIGIGGLAASKVLAKRAGE